MGRRVTLLTTAAVATELAMSEEWVRDHAGELGGIRAGATCRAPLRFEPEAIEDWKERRRVPVPAVPEVERRRPHVPAGVELLPLP